MVKERSARQFKPLPRMDQHFACRLAFRNRLYRFNRQRHRKNAFYLCFVDVQRHESNLVASQLMRALEKIHHLVVPRALRNGPVRFSRCGSASPSRIRRTTVCISL
jgi:hypothetical protein